MNELYKDFMDRKLSSIDGHLIDLINMGPAPGDDKPVFTKTVLADNTALSNTFTLCSQVSRLRGNSSFCLVNTKTTLKCHYTGSGMRDKY